jgi:hypothetical protein
MQTIVIDEEFKSLLPALDKDTFAMLEANIIENGCRDSLVLWNDILIDGHNRYAICSKHNIPFNTVSKEFASREEVLIWIISTQVSRRNLTPIQLSHYRGLHYKADKKIVTNVDGINQFKEVEEHSVPQPQNLTTATRLANKYKVSSMTIKRDAKVAEAIDAIGETSQEAKRMILSGETKIDKKELEALSAMTEEVLAAIAMEIERGTYEKGSYEKYITAPDKPATAGSGSYAQPGNAGMHSSASDISALIDGLYADIRNLTKNKGKAALKTALRTCIDILEDLYTQA